MFSGVFPGVFNDSQMEKIYVLIYTLDMTDFSSAQILIYKDNGFYATRLSGLGEITRHSIVEIAQAVQKKNTASTIRILVRDEVGEVDAYNPENGTILLDPIGWEENRSRGVSL